MTKPTDEELLDELMPGWREDEETVVQLVPEYSSVGELMRAERFAFPLVFDSDERRVQDQLNERYAHGGGWRGKTEPWTRQDDGGMLYPGDPVMLPLSRAMHAPTRQMCWFYPHAMFCIVEEDGSFEMARLD